MAQSAWDENSKRRMRGESRFFAKDYADKILSSFIDPNTTLIELQDEARRAKGLAYPPQSTPDVKAACEAALVRVES